MVITLVLTAASAARMARMPSASTPSSLVSRTRTVSSRRGGCRGAAASRRGYGCDMGVQQAEAEVGAGTDHGRTIRDSVERRIRDLISSGELGPDGRLPTERELAAQLGVSRTTVRQVLDRLEHEGSVHRRRGRSGGTFVSRRRVDIDFGYLAGIPAYLRAQGFRPGAHVVSARMIPADDTTADASRIPATRWSTRWSGSGWPTRCGSPWSTRGSRYRWRRTCCPSRWRTASTTCCVERYGVICVQGRRADGRGAGRRRAVQPARHQGR